MTIWIKNKNLKKKTCCTINRSITKVRFVSSASKSLIPIRPGERQAVHLHVTKLTKDECANDLSYPGDEQSVWHVNLPVTHPVLLRRCCQRVPVRVVFPAVLTAHCNCACGVSQHLLNAWYGALSEKCLQLFSGSGY
jgi:hypothetical protein